MKSRPKACHKRAEGSLHIDLVPPTSRSYTIPPARITGRDRVVGFLREWVREGDYGNGSQYVLCHTLFVDCVF